MHTHRFSRTIRRLAPAGGLLLSSLVLWAASAASAHAASLLTNGAFNIEGPEGPIVSKPVPAGNGVTAAQDWLALWATPGTTFTELVPSTRVRGATMIHVIVDGTGNGLEQVFGPFNTGPTTAFVCAWVYLRTGTIGIGIGNGGNSNTNDMVLNKRGSWEMLQVSNGHTPVNQIVLASLAGGAEFFVESIRVDTTRVNCKPK